MYVLTRLTALSWTCSIDYSDSWLFCGKVSKVVRLNALYNAIIRYNRVDVVRCMTPCLRDGLCLTVLTVVSANCSMA